MDNYCDKETVGCKILSLNDRKKKKKSKYILVL